MWSAIKTFFGKSWKWLKVNWKWVLIGAATVGVVILTIIWFKRNKQIEDLKYKVALLKAKLKLESLAAKNGVLLEDLKKLQEKDKKIKEEIDKIELDLVDRIPNEMTAEEIAQRFRDLL